ncbi:ABC transporter [Paenibacillus alvei A6-6i-x]|nr:ABC transporter [Paenibacillus alvei A6-6i-x]
MSKRLIKSLLFIIFVLITNYLIFEHANAMFNRGVLLKYEVLTEKSDLYQVFFSKDGEFSEENSSKATYDTPGKIKIMEYSIPENTKHIRFDLGSQKDNIRIKNISMSYLWKSMDIGEELLVTNIKKNDIGSIKKSKDYIEVVSTGEDPFLIINLDTAKALSTSQINEFINIAYKTLLCIVIDILFILCFRKYQLLKKTTLRIYHSRRMIWDLSKNDFKTKYAGSYLGIFWAFVQPVMTVLIYWFVFQVGFRTAPIEDFPFVLWLVVGLIPWFFFSDAVINAANSMLEYSYLVKKVVFNINILPGVKIVSAFFIHIFFIGFAIILFLLNGYFPSIYLTQVVYYTICTFMLVLGISYATSAIIVFFKDLGQLIAIVLQMGLWLTPIIWSYGMVPEKYQWIFKLNPMFYIVEGYRDSFINHVWVWEHLNQTVYFWVVTIGLLFIGTKIFKRLKVHFADVL